MTINVPRGTVDLFGKQLQLFNLIINTARDVMKVYCYDEIQTPIFEEYRLFERGVGETTDVVQKEMFIFGDDENRYVLRPELTAPVARFIVENTLNKQQDLIKLWYAGAAFRKERPQKGRQRQFHQIGIECVGADSPGCDVEVISVFESILQKLQIVTYKLYVNSIGCANCRKDYRNKIKEYYLPKLNKLCKDCNNRYERNVFRLLDCKVQSCRDERTDTPPMKSFLCRQCADFHKCVLDLLSKDGVKYIEDNFLFRGFDYYTRTVFEWRSSQLGAQSEISGGGHYDNLLADIGGDSLPGVGFACGVERLMILLENNNPLVPQKQLVYGIYVDEEQKDAIYSVISSVRAKGIPADMSFITKSVKSQMRQAGKQNAKYVCILGKDEADVGKIKIKNMSTGEEKLVEQNKIFDFLQ
ncbi:MAG: histidine--tRNA ligase [Planctomycetes bacterium]|nr:histidine--tRNA ligase [Planctomycetota bacterium]